MKKYFKKFSFMFVMLLAVMGVGIIQDGSVVNAATFGKALPTAEDGWKRFDDNDIKIEYSNGFVVGSSVSSNWYEKTRHASVEKNSTMKFKFYGSSFRILGGCNNGAGGVTGSNNISVTIDDSIIGTCSCYGELAYTALCYEKTNLTKAVHDVTIQTNDTNYAWIDAIDIDDSGALLPYDYNKSIDIDKSSLSLDLSSVTSGQLIETTTPASINVKWKSSDESVAKVDENGKVTAVDLGTCQITATIDDEYDVVSDTCDVNVGTPITGSEALITIDMNNGMSKEYHVTSSELSDFIRWYNSRSNSSGKAYYIFTSTPASPYKTKLDYVAFDKINDFEVQEY